MCAMSGWRAALLRQGTETVGSQQFVPLLSSPSPLPDASPIPRATVQQLIERVSSRGPHCWHESRGLQGSWGSGSQEAGSLPCPSATSSPEDISTSSSILCFRTGAIGNGVKRGMGGVLTWTMEGQRSGGAPLACPLSPFSGQASGPLETNGSLKKQKACFALCYLFDFGFAGRGV